MKNQDENLIFQAFRLVLLRKKWTNAHAQKCKISHIHMKEFWTIFDIWKVYSHFMLQTSVKVSESVTVAHIRKNLPQEKKATSCVYFDFDVFA